VGRFSPYLGIAEGGRHSGGTQAAADDPVLIVDDDETARRLAVLTLETAGFDTIDVECGQDALDVLARRPIAAMLLDIHMPGMSGLELLERVRGDRTTTTLPVILVTGDDDVADRVEGLRSGATDYVVKPFEPDELLARVEAALRGQAAWAGVLEEHLRVRSIVASSLGRLDVTAPPEHVAAAICRDVRVLTDIASAALLAFTSGGIAVVLGAEGPLAGVLSQGRPLPGEASRRLIERAARGPWIQPAGDDAPFVPVSSTHNRLTLAAAPYHHRGQLMGLLVLTADRRQGDASPASASGALATAIDVAALVGSLLGPALEQGRSRRDRRARMLGVLRARAYGSVFQPIARVDSRAVVGYEALTRFADGVAPDRRFAEAAGLGLGAELELATLTAAAEAARALPSGAWVSFNVSPGVLVEGDLHDLLDRADHLAVLELTEHDPVDDYGALRSAVSRLGEQVRLSIDDAGSGFATLRHVLALAPAFVKLDRSWISGLDQDPTRQALVAGLSHFASRTGCKLIAEGVETEPELETLRDLSADLAQGFLLGLPARIASPAL